MVNSLNSHVGILLHACPRYCHQHGIGYYGDHDSDIELAAGDDGVELCSAVMVVFGADEGNFRFDLVNQNLSFHPLLLFLCE